MIRSRGFTVVELVVVMVIMAILLTLGVASFNGSQANARDAERKADIDTIAKSLEARYAKGNLFINSAYITRGAYPSVNEIRHAEGEVIAGLAGGTNTFGVYIDQLLPGAALSVFTPPGATGAITATFKPICTAAGTAPCNVDNTAEDATKISAAINGSSAVYVYEPIDANKNICFSTECVRFNLYYRPEVTGTTQTKASKHQ